MRISRLLGVTGVVVALIGAFLVDLSPIMGSGVERNVAAQSMMLVGVSMALAAVAAGKPAPTLCTLLLVLGFGLVLTGAYFFDVSPGFWMVDYPWGGRKVVPYIGHNVGPLLTLAAGSALVVMTVIRQAVLRGGH